MVLDTTATLIGEPMAVQLRYTVTSLYVGTKIMRPEIQQEN